MPEVRNELVLEASPADVWALLADTARYSTWNPRLLRVDGALTAGAVVTLHYAKDEWLPARFVVDVDAFTPERELRWSGPRNAARALLRASHFFLLSPHPRGTSLVHAEVFAGALASLLWPLVGAAVARNHADVNAALVRRFNAR